LPPLAVIGRSLTKRFEDKVALRGVSIEVEEGGISFVIGPSGCGKTTLLKVLSGFLRPDEGEVEVLGFRLFRGEGAETSLAEARRQMGIVFQANALFDSMNVLDNVLFPLRYGFSVEMTRSEEVDLAVEMLRNVELGPEVLFKYPSELSGGMRKRVAIARALIRRPRLILYDEPTTGLDPITSSAIGELIASLSERFKTTSVVVSHDIMLVKRVAKRVMLLMAGSKVWEGSKEELLGSEDPYVVAFLSGRRDLLPEGGVLD